MKILILADNQAITKAGILYYCDKVPGFYPMQGATNKKELIQLLMATPDAIVMLDYTLFDLTGADELIILQERFKQVYWILFSEELSDNFIRRVILSSDAFSIVMKDASDDELQVALYCALRQSRYICRQVSNMLLDQKSRQEPKEHPVLTTTERDILKAIAQGKTTKEIATERFSSIHTITTHRKNIFRKLEVNTVHEATKYALRAGILDSAEYYI